MDFDFNGSTYTFIKENKDNSIEEKRKKYYNSLISFIDGLCLIIGTGAYIILGCINDANWSYFWPLIIASLIPARIIKAIYLKDINYFPIWAIALTVYFFIGVYGYWHPYWVILLIIPIFYSLVTPLKKLIKNKREYDSVK